jgi:hypothetical protein
VLHSDVDPEIFFLLGLDANADFHHAVAFAPPIALFLPGLSGTLCRRPACRYGVVIRDVAIRVRAAIER